MITVKFRPDVLRQNTGASESPSYLIPGIINWHLSNYSPSWLPPTDVFETESQLIVRVEIAGMEDDDFSIQVSQNHLTIRGMRSENSDRKSFHQMEIHYGEFNIDVDLPVPAEVDKAHAEYNSGFLLVIFPIAKPRHIKIDQG
jgi:HSP20 family protein